MNPASAGFGLSPRVRGNRAVFPVMRTTRRSIPACAGEPRRRDDYPGRRRVYPRVCGGTIDLELIVQLRQGLSPRVRGNHVRRGGHRGRRRSIPACAGEPSMSTWSSAARAVYPRVCGGTDGYAPLSIPPMGLSPRVRGNRLLGRWAGRLSRSIPACAGEPISCKTETYAYPVYPRVCGGTVPRLAPSLPDQGLSPRVRGNRLLLRLNMAGIRSIPACAGEPSST